MLVLIKNFKARDLSQYWLYVAVDVTYNPYCNIQSMLRNVVSLKNSVRRPHVARGLLVGLRWFKVFHLNFFASAKCFAGNLPKWNFTYRKRDVLFSR